MALVFPHKTKYLLLSKRKGMGVFKSKLKGKDYFDKYFGPYISNILFQDSKKYKKVSFSEKEMQWERWGEKLKEIKLINEDNIILTMRGQLFTENNIIKNEIANIINKSKIISFKISKKIKNFQKFLEIFKIGKIKTNLDFLELIDYFKLINL